MSPFDVERRLASALPGAVIRVADESAAHVGHAGASSGGGHFRVYIVTPQFSGLSRLARHRLVYDSLADFMRDGIHALAVVTQTPEEAAAERVPAKA